MHEKGCILEVVVWKRARTTLYWRLRRLLLQHEAIKRLLEVQPHLVGGQAEAMLRRWFIEDKGAAEVRIFITYPV